MKAVGTGAVGTLAGLAPWAAFEAEMGGNLVSPTSSQIEGSPGRVSRDQLTRLANPFKEENQGGDSGHPEQALDESRLCVVRFTFYGQMRT